MEDNRPMFSLSKDQMSGGVKLPEIDPLLSNIGSGDGQDVFSVRFPSNSIPGIKLPELTTRVPNTPPHMRLRETTSSLNVSPLPSSKLTKHQLFSRELARNNLTNKKSARLSMDIDKRLSSVSQAISRFEKKHQSVNDIMQDAARRSAADSYKNRASLFPDSASQDIFEKYLQKLNRPNLVTSEESLAGIPNIYEDVPFPTTKVGESGESLSDCDSDSPALTHPHFTMPDRMRMETDVNRKPETQNFYDVKSPRSFSPIMENLNDKAFLAKLKKQEGQTSNNLLRMQNRVNTVQQQVDVDRKKANVDAYRSKPLYKLRKEYLLKSNPGTFRQDFMDFSQANGGKNGSWNTADHLKFLKIYEACGGHPDKIVGKALREMKHKSATDVIMHIQWYQEYNSLLQADKNELQKWDMEKKRDREMIYKMASEGQKTKLENEKRRHEKLKTTRTVERQRARANVSEWKNSKSNAEFVDQDFSDVKADQIQKEMLELADKVQSINLNLPFSHVNKNLRPPRKSYSTPKVMTKQSLSSINFETEFKYPRKSQLSKIEDVKLPRLNNTKPKIDNHNISGARPETVSANKVSESNEEDKDIGIFDYSHIKDFGELRDILEIRKSEQSSAKSLRSASVSRLTEETFSHKVRKEAQKYKRMELQSQHGRVPNRAEESQWWNTSNSLHSLQSKKATPNWRKIS